MNRVLRNASGALLVGLLAACDEGKDSKPAPKAPTSQSAAQKSPTRADLGRELGTLMEAFGNTVKSVTDRPTWEPAKFELARIEARIVAITTELQTLPLPSPAETQVSIQTMKQNEDKLSLALGDKNAFMSRLPADVRQELSTAAGAFSSKMGQAQQALYGNVAPR